MANKYKAIKKEVDGIQFDSKIEAKRYEFLRDLESKKEIDCLQLQVRYELIPPQFVKDESKKNGQRCAERRCEYIADFVYMKDGEVIVEDVKGYRMGGAYAVFSIKRKLMLYKYGIEVKEIKRWNDGYTPG